MTSPTDLISNPPRPHRRIAVATGAAGVVAGLALGVTGLASAAGSSPTPANSGAIAPKTSPDGDGRHGPGRMHGHGPGGRGGLVTSVAGDTVTVDTPRGNQTITLNASTTYFDGQTKATRSVLAAGEIIGVRLVDPAAAKPVAKEILVLPAHVEGWVAKVDGATITLTDPAGFTRTVTTGSATAYRKDGAAGTAADVKVGVFIRAAGKVAGDGTTLTASRIGTGAPGRHGMMPGGGHDGGPGAGAGGPGAGGPDASAGAGGPDASAGDPRDGGPGGSA